VLVELRALNVFLIPNKILQKYVRDAQSGGRKSIPLDEMEVYAWLVESQNGFPLDFLSIVDRLLESETG
jgi:recombination protein U